MDWTNLLSSSQSATSEREKEGVEKRKWAGKRKGLSERESGLAHPIWFLALLITCFISSGIGMLPSKCILRECRLKGNPKQIFNLVQISELWNYFCLLGISSHFQLLFLCHHCSLSCLHSFPEYRDNVSRGWDKRKPWSQVPSGQRSNYDLKERVCIGSMTAIESATYQRIPTDEAEAQMLASADLDDMKSEIQLWPLILSLVMMMASAPVCWECSTGWIGEAHKNICVTILLR